MKIISILEKIFMNNIFHMFLLNFLGYLYIAFGNMKLDHIFNRINFVQLCTLTPSIYFFGPYWMYKDKDKIITTMFTIGCIIGFHFTYLDKFPIFRIFMLKPSAMAKWTWEQWFFFTLIIILLIVCLSINIKFIIKKNLSILYAAGYLLSIFTIVTVTSYLSDDYELHLHHFFTAMFLLPITAFPYSWSALFEGLFYGVYFEGIATWGIASLWTYKPQTVPIIRQNITKNH